jgi:hypothetical protein
MKMNPVLPLLSLLALPLLVLADPDLDPLVGEWSISTTEEAGDCADMRMVFDFEGNYSLRVADEGRWQTLMHGQWRRDGDRIVTETDGRSERMAFEIESRDRMVLVSEEGPIDRELGVGYLDLGRCAAY